MTYTSKNRRVDYIVLGLSVFLIFCLLFESYIQLPNFVSWVGRWHPLILHFPIVILMIAVFLGLSGKKVPNSLLITGVLSALLTAVSGFFLGKGNPVRGDLLFWHQWLGASVALIAAIWYTLSQMQLDQKFYTKVIQVILIGLIGVTGHFGGMITHGEDYLALPTEKPQAKIPQNPLIYKDIVMPILKNKCVSCHNLNKQKGDLMLTSLTELYKGGKSGNTLIAGDPMQSELIRRVHLPMDDEKHMPPEGKTQLIEVEIAILERWISLGSSDTLRMNQLEKTEPLVGYIKGMKEPDPIKKWTNLPKIADSTLQNLSSDYVTIKRISSNSDALSVDMYLSPKYDSKPIIDLKQVANNIIELDLSGLPINQKEIKTIASLNNLEWLEIDKCPITDNEIQELRSLKNLELLKVYQTAISDVSISTFKELPKLKKLYISNTKISEEAVKNLQKEKPNLLIDNGINKEEESLLIAVDSII